MRLPFDLFELDARANGDYMSVEEIQPLQKDGAPCFITCPCKPADNYGLDSPDAVEFRRQIRRAVANGKVGAAGMLLSCQDCG